MTEQDVRRERRAGAVRLFMICVLSMAHELPGALLTIVTPTVFTKSLGLPVSHLGVFSIPVAVTALKWLWAPLVDAYGSDRFGRRRSWIVPASLTVSLLYLVIASIEPSLDTLPWIITLFVLVKVAFSTHEIAADAYVIEAVGPKQRGIGSSAVWFGKEVGQVMGLAGTLIMVDRFGWAVGFAAVALLFSVFNAVVFLKGEVPPSEESRRARLEGRRASILNYVRHPINRRVLLLTFVFSFVVQMIPAVIGPFLGSKGLSLSEVGLTIGVAASFGAGLSLAIASVVVHRIGPKRTSLFLIPIGLCALPLFIWIAASDEPSVRLVAAAIFVGSLCTAPIRMAFYAARMGWTSKAQVGTDFTTQQSLWFLGFAASIAVSGWLAATIGWVLFFAVNAVLTVMVVGTFVRLFDEIDDQVSRLQENEADPLPPLSAALSDN
ncbi:MAG: MFS transporter [Pseudomonadota bacterium]